MFIKKHATKSNRRCQPESAKTSRQRPQGLLGYGLLLVIGGVVVGTCLQLLQKAWPINHVRIEGDLYYIDNSVLQQVLADHMGTDFLQVDVANLTSAVRNLAWIDKVGVRKIWPDTIQVSIKEQVPVARWDSDGFVNQHGKLFFPVSNGTLPENLPILRGPTADVDVMVAMMMRLKRILAQPGTSIQTLVLNRQRSWKIHLADSAVIDLGSSQPEKRLRRFVAAFASRLQHQGRKMLTVDLRYPNGFAIRWQKGSI